MTYAYPTHAITFRLAKLLGDLPKRVDASVGWV